MDRGQYLANHVAACMGCHSPRDYSQYSGPHAQDALGAGGKDLSTSYGFPKGSVIHAPNLTPAALGAWSDPEIARATVSGLSRDGHALFSVMPFDRYNNMAQDDLVSVLAYLRTLPAASGQVPPRVLTFPLNLVVKKLHKEPHLVQHAPAVGTAEYGAYLASLASLANCVWCHTPVDGKWIPKKGAQFSGGHAFPVPSPGGGVVYSANLTPDDATGLGGWSKAAAKLGDQAPCAVRLEHQTV